MNDGLVSNNIKSICQDSLGFIWIGTEEGLSKFDSQNFKNFTTEDGLKSVNIQFVVADKLIKGAVWISYQDGGISRFVDGHFINPLKFTPESKEIITAIFQENDGTIWCGTEQTVFIIKQNKLKKVDQKNKIQFVYNIDKDARGNILIAAGNGLFEFNRQTKLLNEVKNSNPDFYKGIVSIYPDENGAEWYLKNNGTLIKNKNGKQTFRKIGNGDSFFNLSSSPDNKFIYASSNNGLFKIEKDNLKVYSVINEKKGLQSNNVINCLVDRESILWLGLNNNGISKLEHQNLFKLEKEKYFTTSFIDENNHLWLTSENGLLEVWRNKFNEWKKNLHPYSEASFSTGANFVFYKKNKAFVFYSTGIINEFSIYNKSSSSDYPSHLIRLKSFNLTKENLSGKIFKGIQDNYGNLWLSVLDLGVIVIDGNTHGKIEKIYNDKNGLPDNSVRCIYEDSEGNIWLGGYNNGLAFFSKDKILKDIGRAYNKNNVTQKLFTTRNGLSGNDIRAISEDKNGRILIGTRYGGLAVYNNGEIKILSRGNGLISNGIWDISVNSDNSFWIATQAGIQKIIKGFSISNELNEEIPNIPFFSIAKRKNLVAFASRSEIYIYEQGQFKDINNSPIYFNKTLVNGKEFALNDKVLTNNQNNITFEFTLINNLETKTRIYYYRLLNVDNIWHKLVNKNSVTYASLNPGKYIFEVNTGNFRKVFNNYPATLSFSISQPFYLEWWFILSWIILILVSGYFYIILKNKRKLEIEKIRMKIAEDLHDEIGSGLTKIAILSEHALVETKEKKENLNKLSAETGNNSITRVGKIARDLVDQMIDVIWSIDPRYDSLDDFIFSFKNFAYETCEAKNIKLIITTGNFRNVKVNSQIKRNLQLIAKETINNAIKYSDCTEIKFLLEIRIRNIFLSIEDNGKGFERNKIVPGKGLLNIEKNAAEISGTCSIISKPGKGTNISVSFPLPK